MKMPWLRRTLPLLATLLVLVTVAGIGGREPAAAAETATVATDSLNLRAKPSTDAEIITTMYWGELVEVVRGPSEAGWYKVWYEEYVGWAHGKYLAFGGGVGASDGEAWIDINRTTQTVSLLYGDTVVASYWAALGWDTSDDGYYATASGTYYVYEMRAGLHWSELGQVYITHWVGFDPDRANGFHSYSRDEAGNVIPGGDGPTGGCPALSPGAAAELYDFASIGTRVEVHW
jgi:hypothetical protein